MTVPHAVVPTLVVVGPTLDAIAKDPAKAGGLTAQTRNALLLECAVVLAALGAVSVAETEQRAPADETAWLTVAQVAANLNLSIPYVYQLARRGDLPAVKKGKYVRVPADKLHLWAEALAR